MKWIDIESGERPNEDQTILGRNDKFSERLPQLVCWYEDEQEFMPIDPHSRLPVKITHYCIIEKPIINKSPKIWKRYA